MHLSEPAELAVGGDDLNARSDPEFPFAAAECSVHIHGCMTAMLLQETRPAELAKPLEVLRAGSNVLPIEWRAVGWASDLFADRAEDKSVNTRILKEPRRPVLVFTVRLTPKCRARCAAHVLLAVPAATGPPGQP